MGTLSLANTYQLMFSVSRLLIGVKKSIRQWGGYFLGIIGVAMVILGIFKIGKGLMSDRSQVNWVMCALLIVVGAIIMFGANSLITCVGCDSKNMFDTMADGKEADASQTDLSSLDN